MSDRITSPPASAHQKAHVLYEYWLRASPGPGLLPGRQHIDPIDFPKLLANIWLVDVTREPMRFRIRLMGEAPRHMGIPGKAGDYFDQFFSGGIDDPRLDDLRFIAAARKPVWFRGRPHLRHRTEMFELERFFVPLAADGLLVDMILCLSLFYGTDGREI
jgi:hypothetical protein